MPKDKPEKTGERIVVLETKVDAIEGDISEIKTDQKKGFSDVGKKLDELKFGAFATETKLKSKKEQRSTSFFGLDIPRKQVIYFVLGAGFIIFMLMSNFPGLGQFLSMVNGGGDGDSVVECVEDDNGEMRCQGNLKKLEEMINGISDKKEKKKTAKNSDGTIVLPEEVITEGGEAEVEGEEETGAEDKDNVVDEIER